MENETPDLKACDFSSLLIRCGADQVLWSASQQAGYCEEKAAGLVAKLEGFGWDCGAGNKPGDEPEAPEAPEAPADTTSDLAPADAKPEDD